MRFVWFLMLFCLFVSSLRSLFPSTKQISSLQANTPVQLSITPSSSENASRSYSTFSSPTVQSNISSPKRFSIENLFSANRKTPKANVPLLSPPSSQWKKKDSPIFFSTVCVVFFYDLFTILILFVVIMLAYVKYFLKFVVKLFLFHVFSFRFVFGDYSTTENVVDTSSAGPNNARKFPFITDVLR